MNTTEYEVDFDVYCKTCKHKDTPEVKDPCNECLDQCWNEETRKPVKWEAAE